MKTILAYLMNLLLIAAIGCTAAWAQATAQISGTVRDQSGAVLPGVEIKATQTDTNIERTTISNETGSWVLPNLPLGPYKLEVALPGFRTYVQTGLVLQVNDKPIVNAVLEVGQLTEQVEVQANAVLVETGTVGISQTIENAQIVELPLNGRNVTELITLTAGAVQSGTPAAMNFDTGRFISVNGGLGYGIAYNLDGAPHTDQYSGLGQPFPFPDALQEFKVETSGVTAQNGGQSGGYVNGVTKSGTNELHGDLFEFVRNDLFNARNYFAISQSTLKRNQFGGTLGGPVIKNKLFYFGGFQGTTTRQDPASSQTYVPTTAMLAGDFTDVASAECNGGRAIALRAPFVNNRIDPALLSKPALAIAAKLPAAEDKCGLAHYGNINHRNDWQYVGRMDFQASSKHTLFGRYLRTQYAVEVPYNLNHNLLSSGAQGYDNNSQALTIGSTYLLSTTMVNQFRLAGGLTRVHRVGPRTFGPSDIGVNAFTYIPHYMVVAITGAFGTGCNTCTDSIFTNWNGQISDDFSILRGSHQIMFGGVAQKAHSSSLSNVTSSGNYNFNGQQTGLGLADFMTGRLNTLTQSGPLYLLVHRYYFGFYLQDTWKMTPRLTATYGVRWEPYFPESDDSLTMFSFDYNRFKQGIKSTVFPNAPAGFYYPGDSGFPGKSGGYHDLKLFQPRLGLAWDVNGDGKMSVRASYGIAYTFIPTVLHIDTANSPPWGNALTLNAPSGGFANPWSDTVGGNPFPVTFNQNTTFVRNGLFNTQPYNIKNEYGQSWNLSIQRQLGSNWLVSTAYTGSRQLHLWTQEQLNPGLYFNNGTNTCLLPNGTTITGANGQCSTVANLAARRKLTVERPNDGQYVALLSEFKGDGTMNYHGMIVNFQRRAVKGVSFTGNYTWSHCIGDRTDFNGSGPNPGQDDWMIDNNRRADRGNCDSDRRHVFNLSTVALTPQFSRDTLRKIASGWRLSVINRISSGSPLNVVLGIDQALSGKTGTNGQRPNLVGNPYGGSSKALAFFLNPAAFANPAVGAYGTIGRNVFVGPAQWSFDTAISRAFQFQETKRVEFRAEAFNLTNSFMASNPAVNLSQNTFGQIRTARDPRILQFALKYVF
jgi:carboxypeptidase family protein